MRLPEIKITRQTQECMALDIAVTEGLEAFEGHFPARPILPGVVQLDWALRFAMQYFCLGDVFAQDIQIKFKDTIEPNKPLSLSLVFVKDKAQLSFSYMSGDVLKSNGRIKLGR